MKNREKNGKGKSKKNGSKDESLVSTEMASIPETISFVFNCGFGNKVLFAIGSFAALLNGLVGPMLAVLFSVALARGSNINFEDVAFDDIQRVCQGLLLVGVWAFVMTFIQTVCFEIVAFRASQSLNLQWFAALLRQDAAFFDIYDVPGIATQVQPTCYQYRRGMGSKFGEGIQYATTVVGGVGFAFVASWKISVLVLAILPVCIGCGVYAIHLSQTKTSRANESYQKAGAIAYKTISSIKTILAFNAVPQMVLEYRKATKEASKVATKFLFQYGAVTGLLIASYTAMFVAVSVYGSHLLYTDIERYGCDPTAGMFTEEACGTTGASILGAFLGFLFAAEGISQVATFVEALAEARVAAFTALQAIKRKKGAPPQIFYHNDEWKKKAQKDGGVSDTESETVTTNRQQQQQPPRNRWNSSEDEDEEVSLEFRGTLGSNIDCAQLLCCRRSDDSTVGRTGSNEVGRILTGPLDGKGVKAILPRFEIDASELEGGQQPSEVRGEISFQNVHFNYPRRPADQALRDFSIDIKAGSTIAFVGPSGSGKSTIVSLIERFYDPSSGVVKLDGINLRDLNVCYLRSLIGYVGQEPILFATTIRENIGYGNPNATTEMIVEAAKQANAHDFIESFPEGYDTKVGDQGSQLSGGQKQRIAIARALVSNNRSILLLDEATSALDSESELIVQEAIDNVLAQKRLTTVIIAHRLSTIRNADVIAVVVDGGIVETGTHDQLMAKQNSYYRKLIEKQELKPKRTQSSSICASVDEVDEGTHTTDTDKNTDDLECYTCLSRLDAPQTHEMRTTSTLSRTDVEVVYYPKFVPDADIPHVKFENVCFSYPSRKSKRIFNGFNLSIKCGETVALVGPSGGGKSTTAALMERFYDPTRGVLEYMGYDVRWLNLQWYRDQIGLVSQEPNLLNDTIAKNIAFGLRHATKEMIIEAAKQANAHNFIQSFPDGYLTMVGNKGSQLSGGQKQRIAIARALLKKPKLLILDEATSALDSESEAIVQAALDRLMASREHTTIVIAHRLSTIRNADRIAYIADGKVQEIGSHNVLMEIPHGRYLRLVESQKRNSTMLSLGALGVIDSHSTRLSSPPSSDSSTSGSTSEACEEELVSIGTTFFNSRRVWREATKDVAYIVAGSLGSIVSGAIYPAWGIMFAQTIDLLFQRVLDCSSDDEVPVEGFGSCQEYWTSEAERMKTQSIQVGTSWGLIVVASFAGAISSKVGFGTAAERLNKNIRDTTFISLCRLEPAFFDGNSVGRLMSVLQDDTTKLYAFAGEPLRMFWIGMSSVAIGVALAFIFVWPVALLSLACIPVMGYALSLRMGKVTGVDRSRREREDLGSPAGILVETLLNIRTVAAMGLEARKFEEFRRSLLATAANNKWESIKTSISHGLAYLLQHWVDALLLFFAGWLLHAYPTKFTFLEMLNSNFALYFSLFGLGIALKEVADRDELKLATSRVFYLQDRSSLLDPMSLSGTKLD
ncbi:Leptomycin B resistance protein pmd1 [Seminavis robusta]|uniref:Leptomycin B resistance protein pmd1 n=1 Tax=Seminavis robusta TaxID=568900 RepID=A0A9N8DSA6_9STRA|nr:Leptomycin B resistance protein pmd1 [Seminavis robusta]|eukprot:Sro316_g115550.1 Leptomycin B resistance protein pmd1 (1474) ;mRNA; f:49927-55309